MAIARSAPSSRSWHERVDAAERIILIRDGMRVSAMPFEQLVAARHLERERGALAKGAAFGRHVCG